MVYENTKPELIVFGLLDVLGFPHTPHPLIAIENYNLNLDTLITTPFPHFGIVIEIDGPHHRTKRQQQKTRWRDGLLTKAGYRVIHIPSELTETQKLRDYLKVELYKAIGSGDSVVNIVS